MYVNDLWIIRDQAKVKDSKETLTDALTTKDFVACSYFSSIKVERHSSRIFLSRGPYVDNIVSLARINNAKKPEPSVPLSHSLYDPLDKHTNVDRSGMA